MVKHTRKTQQSIEPHGKCLKMSNVESGSLDRHQVIKYVEDKIWHWVDKEDKQNIIFFC